MSLFRTISVVVPQERTQEMLELAGSLPGVTGIRLHRRASLSPPGDLVVVEMRNRAQHALVRLLMERGIGMDDSTSINSGPASIIAPAASRRLQWEPSVLTWEDMELEIGKESNMTLSAMTVMTIAGVLATIGIATGALHIVVAGMIIAPGFLPILRISLGLLSLSSFRHGLLQTAIAYVTVIAAGALSAFFLILAGIRPEIGRSTYLPELTLINYWTAFSGPSIVASAVAAIGGVLLVATDRITLTGGAMIGLSLIPSGALVGMLLVTGSWQKMWLALARLGLDIAIVAFAGLLVMGILQAFVLKRRMIE
ncbi:MAG: DUF389 domain-containing protein [Candidatus Geothermincolia bacterium]